MREVRVHVVVTGNDGSTGSASPIYSGSFTRASLIGLVQDLRKIFQKIGVALLFDPRTDLTELSDAELNEDVPFSGGKIKVPPPSVDDIDGKNPNVTAQRAFAMNIPDELVIYFRDFDGSKYEYLHPDGEVKRDSPAAFSDPRHLYVRMYKAIDPQKVAHELGHYFGLAHTFSAVPDTPAGAAVLISKAVNNGLNKAFGLHALDGDRASGVEDTPADPGPKVLAFLNGGDSCGPVATVKMTAAFSDGSTRDYFTQPDRLNIMSYFQGCQSVDTARFSSQQAIKVRNALDFQPRADLLKDRSGRWTTVMVPGTDDERHVFGWKYPRFRQKYDQLWQEGWRLHALANHVVNGEVRYTAVWRPSTEGEWQKYSVTYEEFRVRYDELWGQGWRLHLLNNHVVNGEVRYTAVWRPSTEGEWQKYSVTYEEFRVRYDELWGQGWRLHLLNNHVVNGEVRYTAVWRPSTEGEWQKYSVTYEEFRVRYDELWGQGWRLHLLNNHVVNGEVRYTAVWRPGNGGEIQLLGFAYRDLRREFTKHWEAGLRVRTLSVT